MKELKIEKKDTEDENNDGDCLDKDNRFKYKKVYQSLTTITKRKLQFKLERE
jgi:hypothetical protein